MCFCEKSILYDSGHKRLGLQVEQAHRILIEIKSINTTIMYRTPLKPIVPLRFRFALKLLYFCPTWDMLFFVNLD